jgi:tetratricopeptide (TPR) repeat protein
LDDLHVAGEPTLMLLLLLVQRLRSMPLLVIGTHREAEARADPNIGATLAKIGREGETLLPSRLARDEIATWLTATSASRTREEIDELHELTEGNPLFVKEALALAPTGISAQLRAGMAAVLDERLSQLAPACREALTWVAVLGREAERDLVEQLAASSRDTLHEHLHEAEQLGVLVPSDQRQVRFSHVLLRDRLYAALPPTRRAELHWRAGAHLLTTGGNSQSAAHHLLLGCDAGDLDTAMEAARDACVRALGSLAFEDAVRVAERALEQLAPVDERATEFRLLRAEGLMRAGAFGAAREACVAICGGSRADVGWEARARAALIHADELGTGTIDSVMVRLLREALDGCPMGDHPLRIRVLARLSMALIPPRSNEDREEIVRLSQEARASAERLGDPQTLLFALRFTAAFNVPATERRRAVKRIFELAVTLERRDMLVGATATYLASLLEQGKRAEAEEIAERYEELLEEFPGDHHRWRIVSVRALFAMFDGNTERMLALSDEAIALARKTSATPHALLSCAIQRWVFACAFRDPAILGEHLASILEITRRIPQMRVALSPWFLAASGRWEEARDAMPEVLAMEAIQDNSADFPALLITAEVVLLVGDVDGAALVYPNLARYEFDQPFFFPGTNSAPLGPTSQTLGDLALLLGLSEEAASHHEKALELAELMGARPLVARAKRMLAGGQKERAYPLPGNDAAVAPVAAKTDDHGPLLRREGDLWVIHPPGAASFRLKHSKGLLYLSLLLDQPGREVHVLELMGAEHADSDAGPMLDEKARAEYRERVESLQSELEEAEQHADLGRSERARAELDAIGKELARAVGLGGRGRRAGSHAERARINVQRCISAAIARIRKADPALGRHLGAAVSTGTFCCFRPA